MRPRRGIIITLIDFLLIVITIISTLAMLIGYCASWVSPNTIWWVAFFGTGLNLLMIWNLLLCCFWMARFRWWAAIPAIGLLIGVGYVRDFIQISPQKHYKDSDSKLTQITIATYNVHNFFVLQDIKRVAPIMDSITGFLKFNQPDIVFFQEYAYNPKMDSAFVARCFEHWPYHASFYSSEYNDGIMIGLEIRSRYKLHNVQRVYFEGTVNALMAADIVVNKDTIRLFNCHLQTTEVNANQPNGLRAMINEQHTNDAVRSLAETLKRNFIKRAAQADTLANLIMRSPYPVILGGDFNDTPASYAVSKIRDILDDSYVEAGNGYEYTYRPMMRLWRIDYIMYSPERFQATLHLSPAVVWSDHKPVISRLDILPKD